MNSLQKIKLLCIGVVAILIGCSGDVYKCAGEESKSNFERIVQKILIDQNQPKLRLKTTSISQSASGTKSGLKSSMCVADVEWYYKEGDKETLIEKTTLGFEIAQNPFNKEEIVLIPDVIKLNIFYINELVEKGESLQN